MFTHSGPSYQRRRMWRARGDGWGNDNDHTLGNCRRGLARYYWDVAPRNRAGNRACRHPFLGIGRPQDLHGNPHSRRQRHRKDEEGRRTGGDPELGSVYHLGVWTTLGTIRGLGKQADDLRSGSRQIVQLSRQQPALRGQGAEQDGGTQAALSVELLSHPMLTEMRPERVIDHPPARHLALPCKLRFRLLTLGRSHTLRWETA